MELNYNAYEDMTGNGVEVTLTLNDLLGGSASLDMYRKVGGSFQLIPSSHQTYHAGDEYEGSWSAYLYDDDLMVSEAGQRYQAKIVLSCSYPDGSTETIESEEFWQYAGRFSDFADSPPYTIDPGTNTLTFAVAIDLSLADADHLVRLDPFLYSGLSELPAPTLSGSWDAGDGTWRLVFSVPLGTLTPGHYDAGVDLIYHVDPGGYWAGGGIFSFDLG